MEQQTAGADQENDGDEARLLGAQHGHEPAEGSTEVGAAFERHADRAHPWARAHAQLLRGRLCLSCLEVVVEEVELDVLVVLAHETPSGAERPTLVLFRRVEEFLL